MITNGLKAVALFEGVGASPVTILGTSLVAWWTADRSYLLTLSGSQVTSWKDVVAGYDAVQAVSSARPLYSATSFNGSPGVTFDGVDDELTSVTAALLAVLPTGAAPGEIITILQSDDLVADTSAGTFVAYGSDSFTTQRRVNRVVTTGINGTQAQVGNGSSSVNATTITPPLDTRHLVRAQVAAASTTISVDDNVGTTTAGVPATVVSRLRLGATAGATATQPFNGKLRDIIVTNAILTASQWTALKAWGLPRRNP